MKRDIFTTTYYVETYHNRSKVTNRILNSFTDEQTILTSYQAI